MSNRVCRICEKEFNAHTRSVICTHKHIYECPICGKHIKLKRFKDIESIIMKTHLKEGKFRIFKQVGNKVFFTIDFEELGFGACSECRAQNRDIIEALALKLRKETSLRIFGTENAFQNEEVKEKCRQKHQENYGVDNPFQSEEIKERIRIKNNKIYGCDHPMQNAEIQENTRRTNFARYGVDYVFQLKEFQEKYRENYKKKTGYDHPGKNPAVIEKRKQTYKKRTGYDYPSQNPAVQQKKRDNYRKKTGYDHPSQNPEVQQKKSDTYKKKTGYDNPLKDPTVIEKRRQNYKKKTGFDNPSQNPEVARKKAKTAMANGNRSSLEDMVVFKLRELGAIEDNNFKQEYGDDRYPFLCDFYFPKTDTFLEINGHGTHGDHGFNENNKADIKQLNKGSEKAKNSDFYADAIKTWTERDLLKRETALANGLNYIVLWSKVEVESFCECKLARVVFGE